MPRGHEHAVDIDLHDPSPILRGHFDDAAASADADIVVEAIESAEPGDRLGDHRARLLFVGDVRDEGSGRAALRLNHRDGALGAIAVEVDDENLGAGPGQQDRRRAAIPDAVIRRTATGDDRHLAGQAEIVALDRARHSHSLPKLTLTHQAPEPVLGPRSARTRGGLVPPLPQLRERSYLPPSPRLRGEGRGEGRHSGG